MQKHRVVLIRPEMLLGEGLQAILQRLQDVELVGVWGMQPEGDLMAAIAACSPDTVLIASGDRESEPVRCLIAAILDRFPNLPVIQVAIGQNIFKTYTVHTSPADSSALLDLIRSSTAAIPALDDRPKNMNRTGGDENAP